MWVLEGEGVGGEREREVTYVATRAEIVLIEEWKKIGENGEKKKGGGDVKKDMMKHLDSVI